MNAARIAALLLLLPAALLPAAARAEDRPALVPSRDVDVTYRMAGLDARGQVVELSQRTRWSADQGKLRVDPPGGGTYMVIDYHAHRLFAVRPDRRSVLEMPADTASVAPGLAHAGRFERGGQATVAGLACNEWNTSDAGGQAAVVCLTDDGVLLRVRTPERLLVQAQSVAYGPVDPTIFAVPEDFRRVDPGR